MTMWKFVGKRTLQAIPLLFVISAVVFLLIHAAPGGPLAIYLSNPNVRPEDIERLRRALGLDRPLWQQYWSWLAAFISSARPGGQSCDLRGPFAANPRAPAGEARVQGGAEDSRGG